MKETMTIVWLIIFVIFVFIVGMVTGKALDTRERIAMSYGLYEKDNVWNRIRVDDKGHVICSMEEK